MLHLPGTGVALVGVITGGGAVAAAAAQPESHGDLKQTIDALQAQIDQLRAQQQKIQEEQRQRQEQSSFDDVLREADRHTRLLDMSGTTAGYDPNRGFVLRSDDGNFLWHPYILLHVRDVTTWRRDAKPGGHDDTQNGLEIRRIQLGFDGNLFTPDLTYRIFWQSDRSTGILSLFMAWVQYHIPDTPLTVGGGQFKDPLDHEQLVADKYLLAADRTYVDDILAGGEAFSEGVTLVYGAGGPLRTEGAFTNGFNSNDTNFQDFPRRAANFGLAGRVEYKVLGDWRDYDHFTSLGNHGDLLVLGAGADFTEAGHTNALRHVVDVQWNIGPVGLFADYLGRYTSGNAAGRGGDTYDPSVRIQASYLFTRRWEAFARYDYLHLDGREFKLATQTNVHEITVGANYYLYGQSAKFTADVSYLPNGAPVDDNGNGILPNNGRREFVFRGQFQLLL